jgi:hypothetical protein
MNVRSAILQRLESGQATLEQLLELDYLDRLITRTLTRMVRHERLEEHGGEYALIGQFKGVKAAPVKVAPAVKASPFTPVEKGLVEEVFGVLEEVKDDSMALLDNTVKYIVAILPTLELAEIGALKDAERDGKARKSLIAAIEKLEGTAFDNLTGLK